MNTVLEEMRSNVIMSTTDQLVQWKGGVGGNEEGCQRGRGEASFTTHLATVNGGAEGRGAGRGSTKKGGRVIVVVVASIVALWSQGRRGGGHGGEGGGWGGWLGREEEEGGSPYLLAGLNQKYACACTCGGGGAC